MPTLVPISARQSAGHPEEGRKDLLSMTQQMQIKDPAAKGSTPTEIKEATGFSYPAIRKYLAKEDFSPKRPVKRTEESILDPYKPLLAKMFEEDRRIYHKQRHTAKRIHRRLVDEHGFEGSYSTVQRYAKELKAQARLEAAKGPFLGLEWPAGTMQVDSGRPTSTTAGASPACTTSPSRSRSPTTASPSCSATRRPCACARA